MISDDILSVLRLNHHMFVVPLIWDTPQDTNQPSSASVVDPMP